MATDIDAAALAAVAALPHADGDAAVETRQVTAGAPGLEAGRYDLVFLSDVDQYLPDRARYFDVLRPTLAPHGRLAVTNRMIYRQDVMTAAAASHFVVVAERPAALGHFVVELEPK